MKYLLILLFIILPFKFFCIIIDIIKLIFNRSKKNEIIHSWADDGPNKL